MIIWHPESHYRRDRFTVDALIVIECIAFALVGLALAWAEYLY